MSFRLSEPIILDDRYFSKRSYANAIAKKLQQDGVNCEVVSSNILLIEGEKYKIIEKNIGVIPTQQATLKKIKE